MLATTTMNGVLIRVMTASYRMRSAAELYRALRPFVVALLRTSASARHAACNCQWMRLGWRAGVVRQDTGSQTKLWGMIGR